jgi:hypothetical protein
MGKMDCQQVKLEIEAFVEGRGLPPAASEHLDRCPECAALVRRARLVAGALSSLPPLDCPPLDRERLGVALAARSTGYSGALLRAAAGILFLVGASLFLLFGPMVGNGSTGVPVHLEPLDVRVVDEGRINGVGDTYALDALLGPDAIILLADSGDSRRGNGR